jgi:hypothetical protein
MRNFQKCAKSHKELPAYAQNPMSNFQKCHEELQKCTKSNEELPKM